MATAAECAFAGILRGREVSCGKEGFNPTRDVTRADVSFVHDAAGKLLYAVLYTRNSKARGKNRWQKLPVYLPAGGRFIDPAASLERLFRIDPVAPEDFATTPLFRDPSNGKAITTAQLRTFVRAWMRSIGLDPAKYGAHSLRIGGATAMFAAGADELPIKIQGRWSSDIYILYVRFSKTRAMQLARQACSCEVDDHVQECTAVDDEDDDDPSRA